MKYDVNLKRDAQLSGWSYILTFLIRNRASLEEIAEALKFTDVNYGTGTEQPLVSAVARGDIELVDFLLKNGARINFKPKNATEDQDLYSAAAKNLEMIRYLRKAGLKPARSWFFNTIVQTPISRAIYADDTEVLNELVDIGYDPNTPAADWAPIHDLAKGKGNPAALAVIVGLGADVNIRFKSSCGDFDLPCNPLETTGNITPLMYAVYEHPNPYATVKFLIENGANLKLKTKTGLTASDIWGIRLSMCGLSHNNLQEEDDFLYGGWRRSRKCAFYFPERISELLKDK